MEVGKFPIFVVEFKPEITEVNAAFILLSEADDTNKNCDSVLEKQSELNVRVLTDGPEVQVVPLAEYIIPPLEPPATNILIPAAQVTVFHPPVTDIPVCADHDVPFVLVITQAVDADVLFTATNKLSAGDQHTETHVAEELAD